VLLIIHTHASYGHCPSLDVSAIGPQKKVAKETFGDQWSSCLQARMFFVMPDHQCLCAGGKINCQD